MRGGPFILAPSGISPGLWHVLTGRTTLLFGPTVVAGPGSLHIGREFSRFQALRAGTGGSLHRSTCLTVVYTFHIFCQVFSRGLASRSEINKNGQKPREMRKNLLEARPHLNVELPNQLLPQGFHHDFSFLHQM